jgi:hypothetical protein
MRCQIGLEPNVWPFVQCSLFRTHAHVWPYDPSRLQQRSRFGRHTWRTNTVPSISYVRSCTERLFLLFGFGATGAESKATTSSEELPSMRPSLAKMTTAPTTWKHLISHVPPRRRPDSLSRLSWASAHRSPALTEATRPHSPSVPHMRPVVGLAAADHWQPLLPGIPKGLQV